MPHLFRSPSFQPGGAMRGDPTNSLIHTLSELLTNALAQSPHLSSDPRALAHRIGPELARVIGHSNLDALARPEGDNTASDQTGSARDQVLAAVTRHPAGRSPGLPPDALASLTGLPLTVLGEAVSTLVQSGELVRDAWLVRLPNTGDLLPHQPPEEVPPEPVLLDSERRAIGDRRRLGERRLFERRH
jgi:hypothetical protein